MFFGVVSLFATPHNAICGDANDQDTACLRKAWAQIDCALPYIHAVHQMLFFAVKQ
jgi:hypothetical protein